MMRIREAFYLAALCIACGDEREQASLHLCDGTDALRLSYSTGGSASLPDAYVPSRSFFMLNGKCQLFANDDPWLPVRMRQLTADELQKLEVALDVAAWPALAGRYCSGIPDGPTESYWIYTQASRDAVPADRECTDSPDDVRQRARSLLTNAAKEGDELQGDVRYTLVPAPDGIGIRGEHTSAVPWPLGDATAHLTQADQTRRARRDDAAALRGLRARYLRGEVGSFDARFIPILEANGRRYELRMRDVAPYGDESTTDLP